MPTVLPHIPVQPMETEGDWSRYILFTKNGFDGNLLKTSYGTKFLRAKEIEVAATLVQWKPYPSLPLVLRQPQGILNFSETDHTAQRMRFPNLPHYSVVIHQKTFPHPAVVTSQCRTHPQRILLDQFRNVFVQLNVSERQLRTVAPDPSPRIEDLDGIVELWVRIIGEAD